MTLAHAIDYLGPIRAHRRRDGQMTLDQRSCTEAEIILAAGKRRDQLRRMFYGMDPERARL